MTMNDIRIERSTRLDIQNSNAFEVKDIKVILNGVLMNPSVIDSIYCPKDRTFEIDLRFSMDEFMHNMRANEIHNMTHNETYGNGYRLLKYLMENDNRITIRKVIFNDPATIVFWEDGTKTVVKCADKVFDPEKGLAMAISKKVYGNKGNYYNNFRKFLPEMKFECPSRDISKIVDEFLRDLLKLPENENFPSNKGGK